ncbi:hypothetical protein D9C73_027721 [Collichthys lucidus]|uniref:Uncharacterized protein n=1 Tax=Collichthys lucidus TaxID=240159 RepID=A0A4U5TUH2_COLLU|nr:hypothetical protein D9C73_027721 [Collichthys lucidus]
MSKELRCRLVRNTVTSMISILRASHQGEELRYPSKHEVTAMAKRLVEYYPMLQDEDESIKHMSMYSYLQKRILNVKTPQKKQGPRPERSSSTKRRHTDFSPSDQICDRLNAVSMSKVQRLLQQGHDEWYVERRDLYHTLLYEAHTAGSASSQKGILSFARAAATYTPLIAPSPLPSARVLRRAHLIMEIEKMPMYRHQLLSVTGEILCIDGTRKVLKKIYGDGQGTMQYVTSVLNEWGQFVTTAVVVAAAAESEGCYACMARGLIARFPCANAPGVQLYVSVKVVVLNGVWLNKYRRAHLIMEIEKMPMYRHQLLSVTGEILCIDGPQEDIWRWPGHHAVRHQCAKRQFVTTAVVVAAAAESEGCYACMPRGLIARFPRANAPGVQLYVSVKVVVLNGVWLNKYRCLRGSNYLEGLHAHLFNAIPSQRCGIMLFQSAPPKKMGQASEALLHVLQVLKKIYGDGQGTMQYVTSVLNEWGQFVTTAVVVAAAAESEGCYAQRWDCSMLSECLSKILFIVSLKVLRRVLKKIYGDGQGTMQYVTSVLNEWGQFVTTAVVVAAAAESEGCYARMARGLIARFRL